MYIIHCTMYINQKLQEVAMIIFWFNVYMYMYFWLLWILIALWIINKRLRFFYSWKTFLYFLIDTLKQSPIIFQSQQSKKCCLNCKDILWSVPKRSKRQVVSKLGCRVLLLKYPYIIYGIVGDLVVILF